MGQYKIINGTLVLLGKWNNDNVIELINIIHNLGNSNNHANNKVNLTDRIINEIQIDGDASINIEYLVDKYNHKQVTNMTYMKFDIPDKKEANFITKIFDMQLRFLAREKLNDAQKEAFRDYFTSDFIELGVNSLFLIAIMCSVLGMAIVLEGHAQLYYLGVESFTMHFFVSFILREMIPVMTAVLVASKCATSIASKLSAQKINSEIKMLSLMNISENMILKTKWLASIIVMPIMNVYGLLFSLTCGAISYSFLSYSNIVFAFHHMVNSINMTNFLISQTKSLIFGWWIGLVMCSAGIFYDYGIKNLGKAVVKSIVYSISGIIVFDMIVMFICTRMGI